MKKHIPNLFTLSNLTCGILASIAIIRDANFEHAAYFVFAGLIFDFLDGFMARLLKVSGPMGKELDSLADMVTFGLVPGLIAMSLIQHEVYPWLSYGGLIITLFSALRLAKFNIDTRQSEEFIGLNTPANTMIWIALPMIVEKPDAIGLLILAFLTAYLLVSEMPMISLKFKNLKFKENIFRFLLLISGLLVLIFSVFILKNVFMALPIIIILYLILSIIKNLLSKRNAV